MSRDTMTCDNCQRHLPGRDSWYRPASPGQRGPTFLCLECVDGGRSQRERAGKPVVVCDACGHRNKGKSPKFCQECGHELELDSGGSDTTNNSGVDPDEYNDKEGGTMSSSGRDPSLPSEWQSWSREQQVAYKDRAPVQFSRDIEGEGFITRLTRTEELSAAMHRDLEAAEQEEAEAAYAMQPGQLAHRTGGEASRHAAARSRTAQLRELVKQVDDALEREMETWQQISSQPLGNDQSVRRGDIFRRKSDGLAQPVDDDIQRGLVDPANPNCWLPDPAWER